ncbi:hypothetical protein AAHC03_013928 [Spirometra sp. Aus1]
MLLRFVLRSQYRSPTILELWRLLPLGCFGLTSSSLPMEYTSDIACESQAQVDAFWEIAKSEADQLKPDQNSFKAQDLPLARIKKIMKLDDDVRSMMISAEAPILFAKAAELFIRELTLRAWVHTERNRRRTLQRNDISMAVSYGDTDQFDFLIDIVPREEGRGHRRSHHNQSSIQHMTGTSVVHQTADENAALKAEAMLMSGAGTANLTLGSTSGENEGSVTVVPASVGSISLIQQQPQAAATAATVAAQPTIQFAAAVPAGTATIQTLATTQGLTSATTSASSGAAQQAAAATQIQYVFQLPVGTATGAAGQPFHIQMLPQQFQAASTDAVAATPGTIVAGPNGGLQVLQVVNAQTSGLSLANSSAGQDAVGNRLQTVQVQLSDLTPGRSALLVQPSGGAVVVASAGTAGSAGGETIFAAPAGTTLSQLAYTTGVQIFSDVAVPSSTASVGQQLDSAAHHQLVLDVSDGDGAIAELSTVEAVGCAERRAPNDPRVSTTTVGAGPVTSAARGSNQVADCTTSDKVGEGDEYVDHTVVERIIELSGSIPANRDGAQLCHAVSPNSSSSN